MSDDLSVRVLAKCRQAGLQCSLQASLTGTVLRVNIADPPLDHLRVNVDWEMSVVQTPEGDQLTLISPWKDALSNVLDLVHALKAGRIREETGSSLIWGPWRRTIVTGSERVYGFTKRYRRHPRRRGSSYIGSLPQIGSDASRTP